MPNHTHLILAPEVASQFGRAIGRTHESYTRIVNQRFGWRGYLWQGRFRSFPMDERYLISAVRYVLLNPVRAGLTKTPEEWRWSSARTHLRGRSDGVVAIEPLDSRISSWVELLGGDAPDEKDSAELRRHERTGRPLGDRSFIRRVEVETGRTMTLGRPGRRKRGE